MTQLTAESLHELSRDEQIAMILQMSERLERLEAEMSGRKPPTSHNSSQPPSRDQNNDAERVLRPSVVR